MKLDRHGKCRLCTRRIPLTRTTLKPEGPTCLLCQVELKREGQVRDAKLRHLYTIEQDRHELIRELWTQYRSVFN